MQFPGRRAGLASGAFGLVLLVGTGGLFALRPATDLAASESFAAPSDQAVASPVEAAQPTLDEKRAQWFEQVYVGQRFQADEGWMATQPRHPEP